MQERPGQEPAWPGKTARSPLRNAPTPTASAKESSVAHGSRDNSSADSGPPRAVTAMLRASDLMHMVLAVGLLALAAAVLGRAAYEALEGDHAFYERALAVLNSLLFVLILLEVFRMALAHFDHKRFAVGPFVVIGIISTLRHVITGGAELAVRKEQGDSLRDGLMELGLNGVLVILLALTFVVLHRSGVDDTDPDDEQILPGE